MQLRTGNVDIIRALINAGADVEQTSVVYPSYGTPRIFTPLIAAIEKGDMAMVRTMVSAGAVPSKIINFNDPAYPDSEPTSALRAAVKSGYKEIVDCLKYMGVEE